MVILYASVQQQVLLDVFSVGGLPQLYNFKVTLTLFRLSDYDWVYSSEGMNEDLI